MRSHLPIILSHDCLLFFNEFSHPPKDPLYSPNHFFQNLNSVTVRLEGMSLAIRVFSIFVALAIGGRTNPPHFFLRFLIGSYSVTFFRFFTARGSIPNLTDPFHASVFFLFPFGIFRCPSVEAAFPDCLFLDFAMLSIFLPPRARSSFFFFPWPNKKCWIEHFLKTFPPISVVLGFFHQMPVREPFPSLGSHTLLVFLGFSPFRQYFLRSSREGDPIGRCLLPCRFFFLSRTGVLS